uniref:ATP synthase epsilon chain, chloroplastic n=1 Tax=Triparma laevis TaxID=1534972 RepID=A0A0K2RW23_9STRA|nr:ATP synthase CF1, subunit epsilon [Triparma laevis]BAS19036.1 ATP synthase CF1, subunit epsilon [Triparma laevis]
MTINIRVITPDRIVCSTTAEEIILPSTTGQLGILDGHAPLITALDIGVLRIKMDQKWTPMILFGGFAEIDQDQITILVNDVEEAASLKLDEVTAALEQATLAVENAETNREKIEASQNLKKASARVQAATFLS